MSPVSETQSFFLPSAPDTERLASQLAHLVRPGDTLLLDGPIGVGKTHFARALIQERLGKAEDVPSPTYTLVQSYGDGDDEIWHADLYRLTHPDEILELGLEDAFGRSICLVEWPERLGGHVPPDALWLRLRDEGEGRRVSLGGRGWEERLQKLAEAWNA